MNNGLPRTILTFTAAGLVFGMLAYLPLTSRGQTPSPSPSNNPYGIPGNPPPAPGSPGGAPSPSPSEFLMPLPSGLGDMLQQQVPTFVPPFSIFANPSAPSPGGQVRLSVNTPTFDKNASTYIWTLNGKTLTDRSGLGKHSIIIQAGEVGSSLKASVTATESNGTVHTASLSIPVADLVVTWTAQTSIPKWYKGKALPVAGAKVRLVAMPTFIANGSAIPPAQLIYTWLIDGNPFTSGAGLQVVEVNASKIPLINPVVYLKVEDRTRKISKDIRVGVIARTPRALVYQTLPLGGIEPRTAIRSIIASNQGLLDIAVEPFYFPKPKKDLAYAWTVNGIQLQGQPGAPYILTIDPNGVQGGNAAIVANVSDQDEFMFAGKGLNLSFKQPR